MSTVKDWEEYVARESPKSFKTSGGVAKWRGWNLAPQTGTDFVANPPKTPGFPRSVIFSARSAHV